MSTLFGRLFIPLYLAALGRFATIPGLPSDGLKYLVVESPVIFGPFTWLSSGDFCPAFVLGVILAVP